MTRQRSTEVRAGVMFLVVLLIGGAVLTLANREFVRQDVTDVDITKEALSSRQQAAVDSQRTTSGLLFNLAFATLAALIGLRFSDKTAARLTGLAPVVASGLLGLSMYSAHLLNVNLDFALTHGPLSLIGGTRADLPMAAQFWTFAAAVMLLAWWALSTRIVGVAVLVIAGACLIQGVGLKAQADSTCVQRWAQARAVALSASTQGAAVELSVELTKRSEVTLADSERCSFILTTLDRLRDEALDARVAEAALSKWFDQQLPLLVAELRSPNIAPGSILEKLLSASLVWRAPSGLLAVESKIGRVSVLATMAGKPGDWRCHSDCEFRLPEGKYTVRFAIGAKGAAPDQAAQVTAGRRTVVTVEPPHR